MIKEKSRPGSATSSPYDAIAGVGAALLAGDRLKDHATIHYITQEIGFTRLEAQRSIAIFSELR